MSSTLEAAISYRWPAWVCMCCVVTRAGVARSAILTCCTSPAAARLALEVQQLRKCRRDFAGEHARAEAVLFQLPADFDGEVLLVNFGPKSTCASSGLSGGRQIEKTSKATVPGGMSVGCRILPVVGLMTGL